MFLFLIIVFSCLVYSIEPAAITEAEAIPDSLLQTFEKRVEEVYGITENSTLLSVSQKFQVDLGVLKKQLNLDSKNSKLDNMRLKALGISTYQALLAQETIQYGYNEASTLEQISVKLSIPIKKFKSILSLDPLDRSLNSRTVQSLGLTLDNIANAKTTFDESIYQMGTSVTIVGMMVVFFSLLITSIMIFLLKYIDSNPKTVNKAPDIKINNQGRVLSAKSSISNNDIIAAITAFYIYSNQIEERRRLSLTFNRAKANYWHASGYNEMPNRLYQRKSK
jgi:hypothetical protein